MRSARWCHFTAAPATRTWPANTAGNGPAPKTSRSARAFSSRTACPGTAVQVRRPFPNRRPCRSALSKDYPLTLVFGHSLYYWHQNVLIQHSETLKREYRILLLDYPEGFVEMNPDDAKRLGIRDGAEIRLSASRRLGGDRCAGHARGAQRHRSSCPTFVAPGGAADPRLNRLRTRVLPAQPVFVRVEKEI